MTKAHEVLAHHLKPEALGISFNQAISAMEEYAKWHAELSWDQCQREHVNRGDIFLINIPDSAKEEYINKTFPQ